MAYIGWRARHGGHVDWSHLIGTESPEWQRDLQQARIGEKKFLIATSIGGHLPSATIESMLGVALTLRHVEAEFLLCDGVLPACMSCEVRWHADIEKFARTGPGEVRCRHCFSPAKAMLDSPGLVTHSYSTYLDSESRRRAREIAGNADVKELASLTIDGIPVGEHALAGALRFFARGDLESDSACGAVARRYLEAALLTLYAVRNLLTGAGYDCVVLHHGIYVPQGIVAEVARSMGIRVVTWHPAYRKRCFIFSHNTTYHHALMSESNDQWQDISWDDERDQQIADYLKSRWQGNRDWISFQHASKFGGDEIARELGVDLSRPCIGLLTNVYWDAQLHYPANAFPNMLDWLLKTISYFIKRPDIQLLIRIHPAEIYGTVPSRQCMADEIHRAFPRSSGNIYIIEPESSLSTYAVMALCDSVLIYGTKTGVELSSMGIPVIVAGEAWIRGKGISLDSNDENHYFELLDGLPLEERLSAAKVKRARKYAYHFFFRRMIPLEFMCPTKGWPMYRIGILGLQALRPGASHGLDIICNGILNGTPFVYSAEKYASVPL